MYQGYGGARFVEDDLAGDPELPPQLNLVIEIDLRQRCGPRTPGRTRREPR